MQQVLPGAHSACAPGLCCAAPASVETSKALDEHASNGRERRRDLGAGVGAKEVRALRGRWWRILVTAGCGRNAATGAPLIATAVLLDLSMRFQEAVSMLPVRPLALLGQACMQNVASAWD